MLRVFVSYSHKDEQFKVALLKHLSLLKREGHIAVWDDRQISGGSNWSEKIRHWLDTCDVALLLVSADFFNSEFIQSQELDRLLQRQLRGGISVVPIICRPCAWSVSKISHLESLPGDNKTIESFSSIQGGQDQVWADITLRIADLAGVGSAPTQIISTANQQQPDRRIDLRRLPTPTTRLVGREISLQQLDDYLTSEAVNVVGVRAAGGIGKSALIDEWLNRLAWNNYYGAQRVFGYSFYSQSSRTTYTNSIDFFNKALPLFGHDDELTADDQDRAPKLVDSLKTHKSILILDGVEPLQYRPLEGGDFKDTFIRDLLQALARSPLPLGGLIIVTSRQELIECASYPGYEELELPELTGQEGALLLESLHVRGKQEELQQASEEMKGHALSLVLLGQLLVKAYQGDVVRRDILPPLTKEIDEEGLSKEGRHARRILKYYDETYWDHDAPERKFLYLLGLFDRPMVIAERDVLMNEPEVSRNLPKPDSPNWHQMEHSLEQAGLLLTTMGAIDRDSWDTHPLIREYFRAKLLKQHHDIWQRAHRVLSNYFIQSTTVEYPNKIELERLYRAVTHLCQAGDYIDALTLRSERLLKEKKHYAFNVLSAYAMDLAALSGYFIGGSWDNPIPANEETGLTERDRINLLGSVSYDLVSLGRLSEAITSRNAQRELAVLMGEWEQAVDAAENLVDLMLLTGELNRARQIAAEGMGHSRNTKEAYRKMIIQVQYGAVRHRLGDLHGSLTEFKEAERLQTQFQPKKPYLHTLHGARYCILLFDLADGTQDLKDILGRAVFGYNISSAEKRIVEVALYLMINGWCQSALGHTDISIKTLDQAVIKMHEAHKLDFMPRVLLSRAEVHASLGNRRESRIDLENAMGIADRSGMRLYQIESALLDANLCLDELNLHYSDTQVSDFNSTSRYNHNGLLESAESKFRYANDLIDRTDYGLCRPKLMLLASRIAHHKRDSVSAHAELQAARDHIVRTGHHGLQPLVKRITNELENS